MNWKKYLPAFLVISGGLISLLFFTSLFSISELVYPKRITILTIAEEENNGMLQQGSDTLKKEALILPSQLGMPYRDLLIRINKNLFIRAWFIQQSVMQSKSILMLHDWNRSKLAMLPAAEAMYHLGFNVCLMDLPAHGESGGNKFLINDALNQTISIVIDSIFCFAEINHVSIFADGLSSIPAVQCMLHDSRIETLILQNPVNKFDDVLLKQVKLKWNGLASIVMPLARMKYRKTAGILPESLNLSNDIVHIKKPVMIALNDSSDESQTKDAVDIYENIVAPVKKIWTTKARGFVKNEDDTENNLYRAISAFINANTPVETPRIKSRKRITSL
jgi:hypothetical protein